MICSSIYRLPSIIPFFRKSLIKNRYLHYPKNNNPSRVFCSDFPIIYDEEKYDIIRNRLASIPHVYLLNKEVDRIQQDFYDNGGEMEDVSKWCSKVFDYNAKTTRKVHGEMMIKAFGTYGYSMDDTTWNQWDSEKWRLAVILAWCIELFISYINVLDDILDQSILRRGAPCWYKLPHVGLNAINDGLLMQFGVYKLLQKYFAGSKNYMQIIHEFFQVDQKTAYGQTLDMFNTLKDKPRYELFTLENYRILVEHKATSTTYRLPIRLAMHLAGGYSEEEFVFAEKLYLAIGLYSHCQDDRMDCFGSVEYTGMLGNDIREAKITWFSVKFLEIASEPLKKQFMENYGVDDKNAIAEVIGLYRKVNLPERFQEFEEQIYTEISTLIESRNDTKGALFYDRFALLQHRKI